MGKGNFTEEFKRDAVAQITERGYLVAKVSQRLGVSQHSLYGWKKKFAKATGGTGDSRDAEIRQLKRELARVTEERDILEKQPRISPRMQSEVSVRGRISLAVFCAHDVPLPAHPPQRLLCLAEEPAERAGEGRRAPDRACPQGLAGQW